MKHIVFPLILTLTACAAAPPEPVSRATLYLTGRIKTDDAELFIARVGPSDVVSLHSPGGMVYEAADMAQHLIETGAEVVVERGNTCNSSCVLLLIAAGEKAVVEPGAYVGVHRPSCTDGRACDEEDRSAFEDLVTKAGGDFLVASLFWNTPNDDMRILSPFELKTYLDIEQ
jgi:hypothetical protein